MAFGSATLLVLTACSNGGASDNEESAGEVRVYDGGGAWGDAKRTAFFEPFEKATGIKVVTIPADSPVAMRTTIEAGNPSMDAIIVPGTDYDAWSAAGLLQPVATADWTYTDPADIQPYKVQDDAVPALIYATQIGWDSSKVSQMESWADFWDTKSNPGKRSLGTGANIATGVYEAALLADGVNPDDLYPLDIDRAFESLTKIKPEVLKFWESGAESVQLVADSQVAATGAWNGRIDAMKKEIDSIDYTWNQAILNVDYWGVTKGAPNADNARKFLDFVSQPERQSEFASLITYSPTNLKAFDSIDTERQKVLPTAPAYLDRTVAVDYSFWASDSGNGTPWSEEVINRWQKWLTE